MSIDNYTDRERELRCAVADLQAENKNLQSKLAQQAAMVEKCMVAMNENADRGEKAEAKLAALEKQEPVAEVMLSEGEKIIDASMAFFDISPVGTKLYAAAGAAPVPEGWRSAVAMAYGHLWHVNNEPMAPIPLRSEDSASYAARKLLRDLLTTEERGEAINSVRAMLSSAPKDAP